MEKDFLKNLKFKGVWREYQQRVLDELNYHLEDSKLNIVAAPGAGKTTLGVEVLLRLKSPALILAPTLTIKNQWIDRIVENFLIGDNSSFISSDIKNPSKITVSTYQALHSIFKNNDEKENFIENLKQIGVNTLILDEAHHLRTEWWSTLNNLYSKMNNEKLKIVSLTGTPPYDVSAFEWNNYNSLCGCVDVEISIPELVFKGDLCPHQDLIYFSNLTDEENKIIFDFEEKRNEFFNYLDKSSDILYSIESSPFISDIEKNVDLIYQNTDFTVSLISYLLSVDELNINAKILAEFLDLSLDKIPKFDYNMAEILTDGIIGEFSPYFKNEPLIKGKLKELKLLNGKKTDFTGKFNFKKLYAKSKNKLNAIYDISDFEYKNQKEKLREVVLLDYIGNKGIIDLNIVSVFEKLLPLKINLGILTGNLVVIPKSEENKLYEILRLENIDRAKVLCAEYNDDYLRVETYGSIDIVSVITKLFEASGINILIGTSALLGEGWDSPSINTLVIASIVGSFMLSNQMRGRALRIDKNNPDKTSNIWHLVSLSENYEENPDYQTILKRFNAFEGVSYIDNKIQNGISRLNINFEKLKNLKCDDINKLMFSYAIKKDKLREKWKQVFDKSKITEGNLAPSVSEVITFDEIQKSISNSKYKIINNFIDKCSIYHNGEKNIFKNLALKILNMFNFVDKNYQKTVELNREISKKQTMFLNFSNSLLKTMCELSIIKTDFNKLSFIKNKRSLNSNCFLTLTGANNYEKNLFIKAYMDMFDIDKKNRYLIKKNENYIAVPTCMDSNSKNVKIFTKNLEEYFGYLDIIYTRTPLGYKELLKAKYNTLNFGKIEQNRVWI